MRTIRLNEAEDWCLYEKFCRAVRIRGNRHVAIITDGVHRIAKII